MPVAPLVLGLAALGLSALATRGHIVAGGSAYLCSYCPLGQSTDLPDWIEQALASQADWQSVTETDPNAFVYISDASEVLGKGFTKDR